MILTSVKDVVIRVHKPPFNREAIYVEAEILSAVGRSNGKAVDFKDGNIYFAVQLYPENARTVQDAIREAFREFKRGEEGADRKS